MESENENEVSRMRAGLEHIAAGNTSPAITFAPRIPVNVAHKAQTDRWGWDR